MEKRNQIQRVLNIDTVTIDFNQFFYCSFSLQVLNKNNRTTYIRYNDHSFYNSDTNPDTLAPR